MEKNTNIVSYSSSSMVNNRTILVGDVLDKIREIGDGTIDTVVTSPPYWGLRDYGEPGQWGLEPDFHDYLEKLRMLMLELRRVLKDTGSAWINLGDTYASGGGEAKEQSFNRASGRTTDQPNNPPKAAYRKIMPKCRMGIPERFYVNCIDDGWTARNHIPWIKPNAMPSSVKDRLTNTWESIFFLAKKSHYYFNLDAIRIKATTDGYKSFNRRVRDTMNGSLEEREGEIAHLASDKEQDQWRPKKKSYLLDDFGQPTHGIHERRADGKMDWPELERGNHQPEGRSYFGTGSDIGKHMKEADAKRLGADKQFNERKYEARAEGGDHSDCMNDPRGKNPGDVLNISVKAYSEAHFATFPIELPLFCLKATCPPNGMVLDPFFGSGTVGMAAEQLGLNWCGIELKADYVDNIITKRLDKKKNMRLSEFE